MSVEVPYEVTVKVVSFPRCLLVRNGGASVRLAPTTRVKTGFPGCFLVDKIPEDTVVSQGVLIDETVIPDSITDYDPVSNSLG